MSTEDQKTTIECWNQTTHTFPEEYCVHELVAAQAEKTPERTAVIFEGTELSYRVLNERANSLAHSLIGRDIGSRNNIAICTENPLEMVTCILGVLKTGGAYVPLDPDFPEARLKLILTSSGPAAILVSNQSRACLPEMDIPLLNSDPDEQAGIDNPSNSATPSDLMYIMYTSGSTGTPKGVAVEHRSVANLLYAMIPLLKPVEKGRLLGLASSSFDVSVAEIFLPLITGGTAIRIHRSAILEPERLLGELDRTNATTMIAGPAVWSMLLNTEWTGNPLLTLVSTGEALPASIRKKLRSKGKQLWNLYGPTETTVWSTAGLVEEANESIGKPIANTQVYILDKDQNPVPDGEPGELYIGGAGLARGYYQRPDLTEQYFMANPHNPDERLYRTGDRVRRHADGQLFFCGRLDDQVKLRGYRIELGEVESAIDSFPGIRQSRLILREDEPGHQVLTGYYTELTGTIDQPVLRSYLKSKLPGYMIPTVLIALRDFPLTPNKKINTKALPPPSTIQAQRNAGSESPQSKTEQALTDIWHELLAINPIGVHDNFFALGGHSLLIMRMLQKVELALGTALPVRAVFDHPTIAELSARIDQMKCDQPLPTPTPTSPDRPENLPLSFAQQRLWFWDQLEPGFPAYNMPYAFSLSGWLNTEALTRAFETIIHRHEVLRSTFDYHTEGPLSHIHLPAPFKFSLFDLQSKENDEQEAWITQKCEEEANKPFNLSNDLMLRATLICRSKTNHILLVTVHHIAADGWSMGVLWNELSVLYEAYRTNQESSLEPLSLQYTDIAQQQRKDLTAEKTSSLLTYWKRKLTGYVPFKLPKEDPSSCSALRHGAVYRFHLPENLKGRLQQPRSSLHMVLVAAFEVLLSRYSGQTDIAIGFPAAGRVRPELYDLIGFFINTLILRNDLSREQTFSALLEQVRNVTLEALDHQELPFDRLVQELQPARKFGTNPLVHTFFQYMEMDDAKLELSGLATINLPIHTHFAKFDLEMRLMASPDGIEGIITYCSDFFKPEVIEHMAKDYRMLLEQVALQPDIPLSELCLQASKEEMHLLTEWNATERPYPDEQSITEIFEACTSRHPEKSAVSCKQDVWSYEKLNARANQLANHLISVGVKAGQAVAVSCDRSADLITALLAALKTGAFYVPLDLSYPTERIQYMLNDTSASHIISHDRHHQRFTDSGLTVVSLDADRPLIDACSTQFLASPAGPDDIAYVMYTSGSTGQPKGVEIPHRAILRLVCNTDYVQLDTEDRIAHIANTAFDASTFEIWGGLLNGATIVVGDHEIALSATGFSTWLTDQHISTLFLTTALFNQIAQIKADAFKSVKNLLFGGERADPDCVRRILADGPPEHLLHVYGPTESTTFATWFEVTDVPEDASTVPIGRPAANTQVYLLDAFRQPVPVGVTGELYIGGPGLAVGYHRRPELTAECFIEHPMPPGKRLYKTGDRCRWRSDGNLEFINRLDDQIKLRGHRIEPGEIEAMLNDLPEILQSKVLLREDRPDDRRLVAYYIPGERQTSPANLKALLQDKLPAYMVPSAFVELKEWPVTANGKLDMNALPAPGKGHEEIKLDNTLQTDEEKRIVAIWTDVLNAEKIGLEDNFFELGGHSLMAIQLLDRMNKAFAASLTIADLFHSPTIAGLLNLLERDTKEEIETSYLECIRPGTRGAVIICGIMRPMKLLFNHLPKEVAMFWLKEDVLHAEQDQQLDLNEQVTLYVEELKRAYPNGPILLTGFSWGGLVAFALGCHLQKNRKLTELVLLEPSMPQLSKNTKTRFGINRILLELINKTHKEKINYLRYRLNPARLSRIFRTRSNRAINKLKGKLGFVASNKPRVDYNMNKKIIAKIQAYDLDVFFGSVHIVGSADYIGQYSEKWADYSVQKIQYYTEPMVDGHMDMIDPTVQLEWIQLICRLSDDWEAT